MTGGKRPLVGYVPQAPSFDRGDPVSVLDFFVAATAKWPVWLPIPRKYREQAAASLARVHGEELLDRPMGGLSGGQLQRVLLALAEGHMAAICAHTNLDAAQGGVNDCLARALELDGRTILIGDIQSAFLRQHTMTRGVWTLTIWTKTPLRLAGVAVGPQRLASLHSLRQLSAALDRARGVEPQV